MKLNVDDSRREILGAPEQMDSFGTVMDLELLDLL